MPSFELFIFDFDGTLADSRLSILKSINYALREFSFTEVAPSSVYPLIGKLMIRETFLHVQPNISAEQMPQVIEAFRYFQRENVKNDVRYFPEVRESLLSLKAEGKALAILSNKAQRPLEDALGAFDYLELFDMVLGSGMISATKPDKACVEYIWQQIPIAPERSVMIGDSEVDVMTAKNAEIAMIAVGHGTDSAETLLALGADYALGHFGEILNYS